MKQWGWVLPVLLVLGVVYFVFNPSETSLFPKCPFLMLTGLKCPGCGSQRAVHSLLHLELLQALRYNFLLVVSLPLVALLVMAEALRTRWPRLYRGVHRPQWITAYLVVVVLWWAGRNVFNW